LVLGIPLLALVCPLFYWVVYRKYYNKTDIPYFLLPLDFLLPFSIYPAIWLVVLFVTPRFAVWQWGTPGTGTVQALAIEERFDLDLGYIRHFRVEYTFERENGRQASHNSYISQALFDTLEPNDKIPVHYLSWWPQQITAGDPILFQWQGTVLTWATLVVLFWLIGMALASRKRYQSMLPAFPEPQTAVELLERFELDTWLTEMDDPELWAAVIQKQFPMPEADEIYVDGLRFALGEFSANARLKMQPTIATCFARVDGHHLRRVECPPDVQTDAEMDEALAPSVPMLLLYLNKLEREKRPRLTIVIPRPSVNEQRLPVYTAAVHTNGNSSGATAYWQRLPDGRWENSGVKLNWWMEGA